MLLFIPQEALEMIQLNINYLNVVYNDKTHKALSSSNHVCEQERQLRGDDRNTGRDHQHL